MVVNNVWNTQKNAINVIYVIRYSLSNFQKLCRKLVNIITTSHKVLCLQILFWWKMCFSLKIKVKSITFWMKTFIHSTFIIDIFLALSYLLLNMKTRSKHIYFSIECFFAKKFSLVFLRNFLVYMVLIYKVIRKLCIVEKQIYALLVIRILIKSRLFLVEIYTTAKMYKFSLLYDKVGNKIMIFTIKISPPSKHWHCSLHNLHNVIYDNDIRQTFYYTTTSGREP